MTQDSKGDSMPHVDEGTLHAYLDGELPSIERKTLEMHLAECASCRAMLAEERALLDRAAALLGAARPAERPAPPFEQVGLPRSTRRSPWRVRTPVAWAASIALALGLGYYLHESPAAAPSRDYGVARRDVAAYGYRSEQTADQDKAAPRAPSPIAKRGAPQRAVPTSVPTHDSGTVVAAQAAKQDASERPRADSVSAAERGSFVVIAPQGAAAQPRNAAAAPAVASKMNDSRAALDEAARVAELRGRASTTSWPIISRGAARSLLGTDPVGLPGLARKIRRSPAADGTVVVEQQIDSATTIQIFQRQTAAAYSDSFVKVEQQRLQERDLAQTDRLARYVGRLRVEIAGPLSVDSLNRLLNQVQPLP